MSMQMLPQGCYKTVGLDNACIANACRCRSIPACVPFCMQGKEIHVRMQVYHSLLIKLQLAATQGYGIYCIIREA